MVFYELLLGSKAFFVGGGGREHFCDFSILKVSNLFLGKVYEDCLSSNIITHIQEIHGRWGFLSSVCI